MPKSRPAVTGASASAVVYAPSPKNAPCPIDTWPLYPVSRLRPIAAIADVERLRDRAVCWWRRTACGKIQPKNTTSTTATTTDTDEPDDALLRPRHHTRSTRRGAEQPAAGPAARAGSVRTARRARCRAGVDVLRRERLRDADDEPADDRAERRCRTRRARRPRTRTRGSTASTTATSAGASSGRRARRRARRARPRAPTRASASGRPGRRAAGSTRGSTTRRGTRARASCAAAAGRAARTRARARDEHERVGGDLHVARPPDLVRVRASAASSRLAAELHLRDRVEREEHADRDDHEDERRRLLDRPDHDAFDQRAADERDRHREQDREPHREARCR